MVQGTGNQPRTKNSPHNRLDSPKQKQQQQEEPIGIRKQLDDSPSPRDAAINGDMGDNTPETRPSRR